MGLFDNYPGLNTHELNLDWIVAKVKDLEKAVESIRGSVEAAENAATAAGNAAIAAGNAVGMIQTSVEAAENAATAAENAATAAAETVELFKSDFGYKREAITNDIYRTLAENDPATNTLKEYLFTPSEIDVVHRVTGHVPTVAQADENDKFYHYEIVKNFAITENRSYGWDVYENNLDNYAELFSFEIVGFYSTQLNGSLTTPCQNITSYSEAAWIASVTADDGYFTLDFSPNFNMSNVSGTTLVVKFVYRAK